MPWFRLQVLEKLVYKKERYGIRDERRIIGNYREEQPDGFKGAGSESRSGGDRRRK